MQLGLFFVFATICVVGALNLVLQRHPVSSALSLIVVMASLAAEYLLLGAEFVAAVQVIVYAGAIMVLFVLVIMLLNAGEEEHTFGSKIATWLGIPGLLALSVLTTWALLYRETGAGLTSGAILGDPRSIGKLLFHEFLLPFEITSVLILIAILGAVVLASPPHSNAEKEG